MSLNLTRYIGLVKAKSKYLCDKHIGLESNEPSTFFLDLGTQALQVMKSPKRRTADPDSVSFLGMNRRS